VTASIAQVLPTLIGRSVLGFLLMLLLNAGATWAVEGEQIAEEPSLRDAVAQLGGAKLSKIPGIIESIEAHGGEQALPVFEAMLAGDLYYLRSDSKVVRALEQETQDYAITDPITGENYGLLAKSEMRKVKLSNSVRGKLRAAVSRLTLFSSNVDLRKSAAVNLLNKPRAEDIPLIMQASEREKDDEVAELLTIALAINSLVSSDDSQIRMSALADIEGSLQPAVRNQLQLLVARDEAGDFMEQDPDIRAEATRLLTTIDSRIKLFGILETLFFGLSLGSVLLLVATGLAITFGVMGVINMAHGELIMLGAYTTYVIQLLLPNHIEYSLLLAVPAAFVVSGAVGILIQRSVIRHLHGRPLETLLATFGVSLVLQQAVRSVFSPLNRQVSTPEWLSGSLEINSIFSLTYNRLYIFLFALLVFAVLQLILKRTSLGLNVRAVSQNRDMARAIGVRSERVDAMTFGLGSGIAGIAGVALSQLTNVGPNLGQAYIIDSFMVVVFGGVGNLWGTLVGALSLGVVNKFLEPATGAVLAKILVLVFIILFIQKRPRGLFPQKGRAAE
jgi:urea transport system permease protein